jgi:hypothetical protein
MTIKIDHTTTIGDIKRKLQTAYPFLKIEFSDKSHEEGEATLSGHWYHPGFKVLDIAKRPNAGLIVLMPWHKTGYVEELFKSKFGLYPQIFRNEKGKWIQTAGTDIFTLDEQNEIGRKAIEGTGNYWLEKEHLL